MKYLLSILTFLLTVSNQNCAEPFETLPQYAFPSRITPEEFRPYIEEFEYFYKKPIGVTITFAALSEGIAGVCHQYTYGGKIIHSYIEIDSEYWPKTSEYQKLNLIFHELGHCVLNRGHKEAQSIMYCPDSFMFDSVLPTSCIQQNYNQYIKELFNAN